MAGSRSRIPLPGILAYQDHLGSGSQVSAPRYSRNRV